MTDQNVEPVVGGISIVRISVEKLFGQFTYDLPTKDDLSDISKLFILYGDNGSGKTTILRMLYRLLSHEDGKGHKFWVSKVVFKRFCVELSDETVVEAARRGTELSGPYTATIIRRNETLESLDIPDTSGGALGAERRRRIDHFLAILKDLDLGLHLIPDNRRILGGIVDDPRFINRNVAMHRVPDFALVGREDPEDGEESEELKRAVSRAARWIRMQAFGASNMGQMNVNAMYTAVAESIAGSSIQPDEIDAKMKELVVKLRDLAQKSVTYAKFGLISQLPAEQLGAEMTKAMPPQKREILYSVISPYVGSIEAQLKALEEIHDVITMFVGHLKAFLGPLKTVSYDVRKGFTITSSVGNRLDLGMLSSGEKHLLFLLCNTLVARDKASILVIDEPEISLNIKWQRRLIKALLDCISGANVQLIFATHSIELLAQHKNFVVRLENQEAAATNGAKDGSHRRRRAQDDNRIDSEV